MLWVRSKDFVIMEKIRALELAPFSALLNMIKCNYLEKAEIYRTLLAVLCDYDPYDETNKKRTVHYIEILLSENTDLAMCLMSFLPTHIHNHCERKESKRATHGRKRQKKKKHKRYYHHKMCKHQLVSPKRKTPVSTKSSPIISSSAKSFKILDPCMYNAVKKEIKTPDQGSPQVENENEMDPITRVDNQVCGQTECPSRFQPNYVSSNTSMCSVTPSYKIPMVTPICQMQPGTQSSEENVLQPVTKMLSTTTSGETLQQNNLVTEKEVFLSSTVNDVTCLSSSNMTNVFYSESQTNISRMPSSLNTSSFAQLLVHGKFEEPTSMPFQPHMMTKNTPMPTTSIYNFYKDYSKRPMIPQSQDHLFLPLAPDALPLPQPDILSIISDEPMKCLNSPTCSVELEQYAHHQRIDNSRVKLPLTGETAPVYLGTSSNLSAFPYTHQIVLPNGQMQNMYMKRSGVDVSGHSMNVGSARNLSSTNNIILGSTYSSSNKANDTANTSCSVHNSRHKMSNHEGINTARSTRSQDQWLFEPKNILKTRVNDENFQRTLLHSDNYSMLGINLDSHMSEYEAKTIPFLIKPDTEKVKKQIMTPNLLEWMPLHGNSTVTEYTAPIAFFGQFCENKQKPKKLSMSTNQEVRKKLHLTPAVPRS